MDVDEGYGPEYEFVTGFWVFICDVFPSLCSGVDVWVDF